MPKSGPKSTYRYTEKFMATAVRLSQVRGVAVNDVAASHAIHPFMLSRWRKQAREGVIVTKGVDIEKEFAAALKELRQVKKNYGRLKLEHDLLKIPSRSLPLEGRHLRLHRALRRASAGGSALPNPEGQPSGLLRLARPGTERS